MTDLTKPAHVLIADYFAARGGGIDPGFGPDRLRLDLMSGERLTARNPFFDSDQLILFITLPDGTVRELRPSDIKAMWDARPNWPARIALGATVFILGLVIGTRLGDSGLFLGALGGVFAAPFVIWLLQAIPPFQGWREVLTVGRRLTRP